MLWLGRVLGSAVSVSDDRTDRHAGADLLIQPFAVLINEISVWGNNCKMPAALLIVERQIPLLVIPDPSKPEV